jgi:hypothetical protein
MCISSILGTSIETGYLIGRSNNFGSNSFSTSTVHLNGVMCSTPTL